MAFDWQYFVQPYVYGVVLLLFFALQAYCSFTISSGFFIDAICYSKESASAIAITFDDGPILEKTDKILSILKDHDLESCFFCIGDRVTKHPELVSRIHNDGHIVANHSYFHKWSFDLQSAKQMEKELLETDNAIERIINSRPRYFRPPFGVTNPNLSEAVRLRGYQTVGWNVRSLDTVIKDPKKLLKRITKGLKGGDIVLFHDYSDQMLEVLPSFITHVNTIGLKIVRIDKLLGQNPYFEK